jgi:hypothetical protein
VTPDDVFRWAVAAFGLLVLCVLSQGIVVLRDRLVRWWKRRAGRAKHESE